MKIDAFHYHEIVDRVDITCSMIEDLLINHPATDEKCHELLQAAQEKLCAVSIKAAIKLEKLEKKKAKNNKK